MSAGFDKPQRSTLVLIMLFALCLMLSYLTAAPEAFAEIQIETRSVALNNPDGSFQHTAGAHPDLHFFLKMPNPSEMLHDVRLDLPPGLVGNQTAIGECAIDEFRDPFSPSVPHCAASSQVGWIRPRTPSVGYPIPVYSLVHGPNLPARFGFTLIGASVFIDVAIRAGDYQISSASNNTTQYEHVNEVELDLWGVPADPAHDAERDAPLPAGTPLRPFLRNPTSCSEHSSPFVSEVDSWESKGEFNAATLETDANGVPFVFEGCEQLPFNPSMSARTTASTPDSPSGLAVDLDVPQNETARGQATSDVRKVVTKLPAGLSISPSSASGLSSCSEAEIGIGSNAPPTCPDASAVGTVKIKTPLLAEELEGKVFLARQNENPFGSLFAIYLAAKGPGFYVKVPGKIDADPSTGQLTATFSETPQLPFDHLKLELKSGPRAPLATPQTCGAFTTIGNFTPWSGTRDVLSESSFAINGCVNAFSPSYSGGTSTAKAGAYSPFSVTIGRADGEADLSRINVDMPKGLLAKIGSVPLCGEADANAGTCPEASRIGSIKVVAGPGSEPLYLPEPGKREDPVYLTGPYNGGPYGLSILTHAEAGPFNLGDVIERASIRVNPITARASVVSDPLPQIVDGVPLRLRSITVTVDRPGFIFNPTNCTQQRLGGAIASNAGTVASVSSSFAVAGCSSLKFTPKFSASTAGSTKGGKARELGARLSVKLSYPSEPAGTEANISKVKVELPKQLPSRLVTLQKACLAAVFDANPANCPAASVVGKAKVVTPLLATPLTGPAYFVSHGGEAFPSLVIVLQGSGVTVELVGKTFISHAGITSTTFETVPDVPFSTFELELPQGKFSALGVNGSLCSKRLIMPTDYVAQNGVSLHQSNVIAAAGCPAAKKAKAKKSVRAHKTSGSRRVHARHTSKA